MLPTILASLALLVSVFAFLLSGRAHDRMIALSLKLTDAHDKIDELRREVARRALSRSKRARAEGQG